MKRILLFFIVPLVMLLASASAIALPVITTAGSLSVLSTTYGTASSNTSFTVSGTSMAAGITVTAPAGYEVSTSAVGPFSNSIVVGAAGTIAATTVYVRLAAASTPATYSGNVSCSSSGGATTKFVATVASTVSKAVLTITGLSANNKVYDRTTTATLSGTPALSGIIGSDVVTLGGSATAVFSGLNVGSGLSVTVSGYTIGGANAGNYTLTQPTGLTANITQKPLTVTSPVASNKVYDGTTNATISSGTLVGVILPDVVTLSPSGTFASANVGTAIPITVAITGANAGNYSVTQPVLSANITVHPLTITATGVSKIYGDILTGGPGSVAFTTSGLQNGETIGSVTITYGTGAAISDAVGTYVGAITPSAPTGGTFTAGNYSITNATGTITVTPKALTITGLSANNKVYDRTNAATLSGSAALSGVVGADVVTLGGSPTSTFASINVGVGIAVTVTGYTISGAAAGNYTLTQPAGLTANITAKALTIATPVASNKVYDGTTTATVTGTLTGVISPDVVTLVPTGTFAIADVGTAVAVTSTSTLSGANAGNYTLTQPVGLTANITPKTLTITGLTASNKVYDGTTSASLSGTGTLSGVVAGDVVNLGGSGTGTFASKNVATGIAVTVSTYTISGTDAGNYTLTQPSGLTANITKASLTITATGPLKVTGFTSPVVTGSTTNFIYYGTVSGETVTSVTLTPSPTTSQTAGSTYTVTPSAAAGANGYVAGNYSISYVVYNGVVAGFSYTWTGASSTTWSTSGNWSPSGTPGSTDNVSIPSGTVRAPTVTASTSVNTVTFTGNNTITVNSGINLTVNNGFNVNSGVTAANVTFAGASTSTKLEFNSAIFANYGTFNLSGTGLFQVDNNGSYIYNSGTFTANGNATLYLQGGSNVTHALTNAGTFYAGTSGSNCNIEMDDYGSIDNSGVFYLGPTSLMYYYNDNAQFVIINNQSGGTFTLQSDATGSASVGEIPQGKNNAFTGTFNVERYFQGGNTYASGRWVERSYRIISSCVNTGSTVNGNYVYGLNYIVGATAGQTTTANSSKNAFITGCTGGSTSAGNPSVYLYNESYTPSNQTYVSGNFLGITNITNSTTGGTITASDGGSYSIPVGTGVLFFFRGAATNWATRTVTPYIAPENVTLTSTGNMNVGPYTFKDWYTPASANIGYTGSGGGTNSAVRGFNMLGNPYPCAIDWGT
ncbi:MAG: beta strand repeat-containing protein, partial [Mucilaginibacter sp.]